MNQLNLIDISWTLHPATEKTNTNISFKCTENIFQTKMYSGPHNNLKQLKYYKVFFNSNELNKKLIIERVLLNNSKIFGK